MNSSASNSFKTYILWSTRLTSHSKNLTDNTFSKIFSTEVISGNITVADSDNLPQFPFATNIVSNHYFQNSTTYERDWYKYIQENFITDYFD